jgi:hypothetical protein
MMDALLILGGLLLILTGLVWLVMRAFTTSLLWGIGSLLPPLTLFFIFGHWRVARPALMLSGLGFIPLVVGLTLLASHDSQRLHSLLSMEWLQKEVEAPAELAIVLSGQLNGRPFQPQQGELIDGVLSLREGRDFFAQSELRIRLPELRKGDLRLDVLPSDQGELPEVEISWLLPEQDLPEARRLNRGYTLHLDLRPQAPNKLAGEFHLVLPPSFKTSLSGSVELYANGLRYKDGVVDRHFDSSDTLAYVIDDYLQRRFATRDVQLEGMPVVNFPANQVDLQIRAQINQQWQDLPILLSKNEAKGWAVKADHFALLPQPVAEPVAAVPAARSEAPERTTRMLDRRLRFSLDALLRNPDRYQNLVIRVQTVRGAIAEGRFQGVDQSGRVVLRQRMSGQGEVSYSLLPEDIARIELLEP